MYRQKSYTILNVAAYFWILFTNFDYTKSLFVFVQILAEFSTRFKKLQVYICFYLVSSKKAIFHILYSNAVLKFPKLYTSLLSNMYKCLRNKWDRSWKSWEFAKCRMIYFCMFSLVFTSFLIVTWQIYLNPLHVIGSMCWRRNWFKTLRFVDDFCIYDAISAQQTIV